MKDIQHYINESEMLGLDEYVYINEAWGANKHYASELDKIFADYEKKKAPKKQTSRMLSPGRTAPEEVFAKYPMQILIDKAGYTPKEITKKIWGPKGQSEKKENDKYDYGKFIVDQIEAGKLNKDDMLKWWNEYETEVSKAKWHDPKFIAKQIDPARCWNVYYPKDDSVDVPTNESSKNG